MSTVESTTLADRASGSQAPILDAVKGSARAWVNFDGTGTVSIRDDYNVDSITDNGSGQYTVNFTNAMPSQNYSVAAMHETGGSCDFEGSQLTTAGVEFLCRDNTGSTTDSPTVTATVHGAT